MSVSAPRMRQAVSKQDTRHLEKLLPFGDNMREAAVTDGDKVAAQIVRFLRQSPAVGDLVQVVNSISDGDVNALVDEYVKSCYTMTPATHNHGENDRTCWKRRVLSWG